MHIFYVGLASAIAGFIVGIIYGRKLEAKLHAEEQRFKAAVKSKL